MQDLKEILQRIRQTKQEKKKLKEVYQDLQAQSKSYQELLQELNTLKAKKLQLETALRSECRQEWEKAERLALDIKTDTELLSDVALTKIMKGETIEVTDKNNQKYEPVFKVTFKKA